jgi:hypothetical protein
MSAEVIQIGGYLPQPNKKPKPQSRPRRRLRSEEISPSLFADGHDGGHDFKRGCKLAGMAIQNADARDLEHLFQVMVREAMQRAVKRGPGSRRVRTSVSFGFIFTIARYVATGEIWRA